jgi:hypothetical protein
MVISEWDKNSTLLKTQEKIHVRKKKENDGYPPYNSVGRLYVYLWGCFSWCARQKTKKSFIGGSGKGSKSEAFFFFKGK